MNDATRIVSLHQIKIPINRFKILFDAGLALDWIEHCARWVAMKE